MKRYQGFQKTTAKKREELFEIIKAECFEVGVGICDHETMTASIFCRRHSGDENGTPEI